MKRVESVKSSDCCVCAYAACEGITWKSALRRLRKKKAINNKFGSTSLSRVKLKGLPSYKFLADGSYKTLASAFKYKRGILFVLWGEGKDGHAVAFNGYKIIDNNPGGTLDGMHDGNLKLPKGAALVGAAIKTNTPSGEIIRSYVMHKLLMLKKVVADFLS